MDSLIIVFVFFGRQLVKAKLESSFVLTRRLIDRLIIVTLETGAITVVVILVQLGIYIKYPEDALQHVAV